MADKWAEDHIPADILAAAAAVGLRAPDWYVGRSNPLGEGSQQAPLVSVTEIVMRERRKRGLCDQCVAPHRLGTAHNKSMEKP